MKGKTFSRRQFLAMAAGVGAGALATACAPQPPAAAPAATTKPAAPAATAPPAAPAATTKPAAAPAAGDRPKVSCMFWDAAVPGYREAAMKKFNEAQSKYLLDYQFVAPQPKYYEKLTVMMAGGAPPDLFILTTAWLPEYWRNNVLLNIQSYVDRDKYSLDDFPKIAMDAYKYKGGFYGLPDNVTGWCIYYNSDIFDEVGAMKPTAQWNDAKWTTDDFMAACEKITKKDASGKTTRFAFDISTAYLPLGIFLSMFGASYTDNALEPKECTLDRPEAIKTLQFLADLRFKYGYAPRPEALSEMKANEMVQNGRLAMSIGGGWGLSAWEPYKFKWDIGHFPKGPAKRDNYTFYYPLTIAKASKVPDGAWELLKYYEDVAIKQIVQEGGLQGTRISDMKNLFAASPKPPKSRSALVDSVQNFGWLDPRLTNWEEVWRAIQTELDYLWIGERPADVCARNAKKAADALISAGKM